MPDSDLWFNEEVMHVSELEGGGILRAVERHEAEGHKIYPSQFEYTLQKNAEGGSLKKRKVRGCLNGKRWEGDMTGMYAPGAARDTVMLQLADAQLKGHRRLKMDIKNAYPEAEWPEGQRVFMHMFQGHIQYDASGKPMVYEVMRNYWGAPPAGAVFGQWLTRQLVEEIGFEEVQSCMAMYRLPIGEGSVVLSTIVDDLLATGTTEDLEYVLESVQGKVKKLTHQWDPESYAGFEMRQCEMTGALTVSVGTKVQEYAFMLGVEEGKHESITKGDWDELRLVEDQEGELSVEQSLVRSATGALGWLADIYLDAKPFAHRLQRVSRAPPPIALAVHKKVAANLLCDVHAGITYPKGGPTVPVAPALRLDGVAPTELQIVYDATWMDGKEASVWQAAFTYNGAVFATAVGTIGAVNLSSADAESYALSMALARGTVYRNVLTSMGSAPATPTTAWGDNSAVVGIADNSQSASGLRHIMRRVKHVQQLVSSGDFTSRHVSDKHNMVDFFGKYVSGRKAQQSTAYLMNKGMLVAKEAKEA